MAKSFTFNREHERLSEADSRKVRIFANMELLKSATDLAENEICVVKTATEGAAQVDYTLPVGSIIPYYGTIAPSGWLECNGSTYSISDYPALYSLLGTNKLPDLRESVLVGIGQREGIDNHDTYTLGQFKNDVIKAHNHTLTDPGHIHVAIGGSHTHTITDPGHNHTINDSGHTHTFSGTSHGHTISDPEHTHSASFTGRAQAPGNQQMDFYTTMMGEGDGNPIKVLVADNYSTTKETVDVANIRMHSFQVTSGSVGSATTDISINGTTAGGTNSKEQTGITLDDATTGITIGSADATPSIESATTGITIDSEGSGDVTHGKQTGVMYIIKAIYGNADLQEGTIDTLLRNALSTGTNLIQLDDMSNPAPYNGKVVQYVGADGVYKKGYFYESSGVAWNVVGAEGSGGGSGVTVDTSISALSTNPVQNRVIKSYIDNKATEVEAKIPTIDSTLDTASTNPVQNSAIATKFNQVDDAISNITPVDNMYSDKPVTGTAINKEFERVGSTLDDYYDSLSAIENRTRFPLKIDSVTKVDNQYYDITFTESNLRRFDEIEVVFDGGFGQDRLTIYQTPKYATTNSAYANNQNKLFFMSLYAERFDSKIRVMQERTIVDNGTFTRDFIQMNADYFHVYGIIGE